MKMADRSLIAITGIRESSEGNTATVELQWQYTNLTPFGKVAPLLDGRLDYTPNRPRNASVTFKKYDDGWRLPADWNLPTQRGPWD